MRYRFGARALLQVFMFAVVTVLSGCCGLTDLGSRDERIVRATPTAQPISPEQPKSGATSSPVTPMVLTSSTEEQLLVKLYEQVNPSVVNIVVATRLTSMGGRTPSPGSGGSDEPVQRGEGSGFVYDTQGHIVTNNHVVAGADEVRVTFSDDVSALAKVVGTDPDSDLAVIKVEVSASELRPLTIGDSDALKVGQRVVAIGNPFGLEGTMTTGIVSALGRLLSAGSATTSGGRYSIPDIIQTDAAVNPGNSGGPLLNLRGEVVGVTSAIESTVGSFSGIGLAIPASIVKKVVPALIRDGRYEHPWLGISAVSLSPALAEAMGLPESQRGVMVAMVTPGSPADKAKLRASEQTVRVDGQEMPADGDIIVGIDNETVKKYDDLITYLTRRTEVGQKVVLSVLREGKVIQVEVTLAARPTSS